MTTFSKGEAERMTETLALLTAVNSIHKTYMDTAKDLGEDFPSPPETDDLIKILEDFVRNLPTQRVVELTLHK